MTIFLNNTLVRLRSTLFPDREHWQEAGDPKERPRIGDIRRTPEGKLKRVILVTDSYHGTPSGANAGLWEVTYE